jgi:hypothetical protein
MGLASPRPWQEGGSQESEQNRQGATFIMMDNFVGEVPSKEDDMGQDRCQGGVAEMGRANKGCRIDGTQRVHLKVTQCV